MSVRDAPLGKVVRCHFDRYDIAGEDADVVHAYLPGDVGEDGVALVVAADKLDTEGGIGERLDDFPFYFNDFFGHKCVKKHKRDKFT